MKLFKKMTNKLFRRSGFSLAETLVVLIIILLVSSVVAAGMPAAEKAYVNVIQSADAQLFLSSTLTELRNELSTATEVRVISSNQIEYVNPITGKSTIQFDGKVFQLTTYQNLDGTGITRPLVYDNRLIEKEKFEIQCSTPFTLGPENTVLIGQFDVKMPNGIMASLEQQYAIQVLAPIPSPPSTP